MRDVVWLNEKKKQKLSIHSRGAPAPPPPRPQLHLAGVHSSGQEAAAQHPGSELALRHLVAHCVVDDLDRGFLQDLRLLTCTSDKKKVTGLMEGVGGGS